jgi:hypothetical protein
MNSLYLEGWEARKYQETALQPCDRARLADLSMLSKGVDLEPARHWKDDEYERWARHPVYGHVHRFVVVVGVAGFLVGIHSRWEIEIQPAATGPVEESLLLHSRVTRNRQYFAVTCVRNAHYGKFYCCSLVLALPGLLSPAHRARPWA